MTSPSNSAGGAEDSEDEEDQFWNPEYVAANDHLLEEQEDGAVENQEGQYHYHYHYHYHYNEDGDGDSSEDDDCRQAQYGAAA